MEIKVILLLMVAATAHSIWNTLAKRSMDKLVFFWLTVISVSVLYFIPFCIMYSYIPVKGLLISILSGFITALYFVVLGKAYEKGDLSVVYPLVRGSAPLFVTLSAVVFLHEKLSALGVTGILLVVFGIYTINLKSFDLQGLNAY